MVTLIDYIVTNPPLLAALVTVFTAIAIKVLEKWLGKQAEARNDRKDFRDEIKDLNERIDRLEEQVTKWRDRYYAEQEEVALLRTTMINSGLTPP